MTKPRRHSRHERRYGIFNINTEAVSGADYYGFLEVQHMTGYWYKFWFTLKGSQLSYYERKSIQHPRGVFVANIDLFSAQISILEQKSSGEIKKKHILDIKDKLGKRHWLACESGEVLDDWLVTLLEARIKVPPALHISEFKKEDRVDSPAVPNMNFSDFETPDHLLLVLHGIGSSVESFTQNVETFKSGMNSVKRTLYRDIPFNYHVIPCRWKEALKDLEIFRLVQMCAPVTGGSSVRDFVQDRGLDIMYYMTARFQKFIDQEAVKDLNAKYNAFIQKYPDFDGEVSILAHSLGSVICLNTLTAQRRDDPTLLAAEGLHLNFKPSQLFMIGSPNAVFLAFSKYLLSQLNMPQSFRIYNIFHPYDPISYRIEPILNPHVEFQDPYVIPHYKTMDQRTSTVKWIGSLLYRNSKLTEPSCDGSIAIDTEPEPDPIDANPENLKDAAILGGMYVANKLIEQPAPEITVNSLKDDNPNPSPSPTSPKPMRQALGVPADEVDPVSEDGVFDQRSVPSSPVPGASAGVRVAMETATKYTESGAAVGEGDKGIASKPSDGNQVSQADRTVPLTKGRGSPNKDFTDPASNDSLLDGHAHYPDRKLSGSRLLTTEPVPRSTDIRPSAFRVDFVLQESGIEEVSTSAITALKAHSEYWTSLDTAFVVLSQMIKKRYPMQSDLPADQQPMHHSDGRPRRRSASAPEEGNRPIPPTTKSAQSSLVFDRKVLSNE